LETKASRFPSGEYIGRLSFAGFEISRRASPPAAGTAQISPPDTNAISDRSGETAGSVKYGRGATLLVWLCVDSANAARSIATNAVRLPIMLETSLDFRQILSWTDIAYRRVE
jgi:hypothetical protein